MKRIDGLQLDEQVRGRLKMTVKGQPSFSKSTIA